MPRRARYNPAQDIEPSGSRSHRDARFVAAHVGLQSSDLRVIQVRRIGDYNLESSERFCCVQNIEAVSATELHPILNPMTPGVARRYLERIGGNINGGDTGVRRVHGNRDRNRAGTGANVEHARVWLRGEKLERRADDQLAFRARNQLRRTDLKIKRVELLVPEDVRDRLALFAARDQRVESFQRFRRHVDRAGDTASRETPAAAAIRRSASSRDDSM